MINRDPYLRMRRACFVLEGRIAQALHLRQAVEWLTRTLT